MGRNKKYDGKSLRKKVVKYFDSISRHIAVTEPVATGIRDDKGHMIYEDRRVTNDAGKEIERLEYLVPPTVGGLCAFLDISRDTWAEYQKNEDTAEACKYAKDRLLAWNEEQLMTRSGKDVKGIVFNLQANYDYSERMDVNVHGGVEDFLRELGGKQEF